MSNILRYVHIGLGLILGGALVGCQPAPPPPLPTRMPTFAARTPTSRPMPSATAAPTPTAPPPSPTPSINERLAELINTNGGCRLPCWWGVSPGMAWGEAKETLAPLVSKITDSGPQAENESGAIVTTTYYYIWHQLNGKESQQLTFNVLNDQVRVIHVYPALTEHYLLSQLLTTYGPPSHVWVSTSSIAVNGVQPTFGLSVYYESLGILASYRSEVSDDGADLVGCFTTARPILRLWNPARNPEIFRIDGQTFAKTLELAETGYTLATFYEAFKNSAADCITTPAKLWGN